MGGVLTLTATITGAGITPTGTVTFFDGATALGTSTIAYTWPFGYVAQLSPSLTAGSHSLTATYSGDSNYAGSTSAVQGSLATSPSLR